MKPLILTNGRGRLILNRHEDRCAVTLEIDSAGITQFLDPEQAKELGWALWQAGRGLTKSRKVARVRQPLA